MDPANSDALLFAVTPTGHRNMTLSTNCSRREKPRQCKLALPTTKSIKSNNKTPNHCCFSAGRPVVTTPPIMIMEINDWEDKKAQSVCGIEPLDQRRSHV